MDKTAAYWIQKLGLSPHPEGGHFARTYRSDGLISKASLPAGFSGDRVFSSAIYYLLEGDRISAFHRIESDEMWHFYAGGPITLYVIDPEGCLIQLALGRDFERGERFQQMVRAGCWFAASVNDPRSYALVGCTVAPGFEYEDMELANRDDLVAQYPQHREIIERLTRSVPADANASHSCSQFS